MAIQVKDLRYIYLPKTPEQNIAVDGVSLTIPDNAFVAFIGRTGSGKSTLVQHLNALLTPFSGEIEIDDFKIINNRRKNKRIKELRKHVSLVFQFPEYQLFEETVEKDVAFGLKNFGMKEAEAIEHAHKALLSVGLDEKYFKKSPFELSGGERRRVAIAGILAINPDILVLDEPTAGLDIKGAKDVMSLVKKMHANGKTIIMVSHDMDLVMKYCDLVYVLKDGKLAYQGTTEKLFDEVGEDSAIEIPPLYQLAQKLKRNGAPIQIEKIKSVDDLIEQVKGWKKRHE